MFRREALALAGTVVLPGCSAISNRGGTTDDGEEADNDSPTPTDTPTPTQTATPTPTATETPSPTPTPTPGEPELEFVNPIFRWNDFGDAARNKITSVGRRSHLPVAARFQIWHHSGTIDFRSQVRAYDSAGTRVGMQSASSERVTSKDGYDSWEHYHTLDTTGWGLGSFDGDFIVRDNVINKTSGLGNWSVDVVEPFTESEVSLREHTIPSTVRPGETFNYTLVFENETNRDSSIVSPISSRVDGGQWYNVDERRTYILPGNQAIRFPVQDASFEEPGEYEYRLDTVDISWEFTVER